MMKSGFILLLLFVCLLFTGCSHEKISPIDNATEKLQVALIIGSAESPDPVLLRVQSLEEEGVVQDVVVMESFPVQIQLKATQVIIDELNNIPRVKGHL